MRHTTVILTTHDLGDIQELCERLIVINSGVLMEDGNLSEIIADLSKEKTIKDVSIEEIGIDDIIKIVYGLHA